MEQNNNNCEAENEENVLKVLIENCRLNNSEIAEKVDITRQSVSRIIKRLENDKVIWGYTAIASDFSISGIKKREYVALITTSNVGDTLRRIKKVVTDKKIRGDFIKSNKLKSVDFVCGGIYHGPYDVMICFRAVDISDAKRLVISIKNNNPYVDKVDLLQPLVVVRRNGFPNPRLNEEIDSIIG